MTFSDIKLPSRPLSIKRNPLAHGTWYLLAFVMMAGLAAFLAVWQAPGLVRDYQISQNPVILADGDIVDGECTTRRGITDCEARLVYSYDGQDYDTHVSMAFLDFHSGDYMVELVISGDQPALATLSLGLDMLWNRLAVFTVLFVLVAGAGIGLLVKALQVRASNAHWRQPGLLTLVPVEIASNRKVTGGALISYIDRLKGPKSKRISFARFGRNAAPLLTAGDAGDTVAVAVRHPDAALPALLDAALLRLDLTDAERETMLASIAAPPAIIPGSSGPSLGVRLLRALGAFVAIIAVIAIAVLGYWVWYVTSASSQFDSIGMEINNMLPAPLNSWGCDQLEQRFTPERAPFGCTTDDYVSWK